MLENGMQKKVTEPYLVDALSFTEAEARIIEEVSPFISGEFSVSAVKRANFSELFFDETGDRWYKCKLNFITLDEKSGMEKRTASYMLVQAADFETALKNLVEGMKGTMADWVIVSITYSPTYRANSSRVTCWNSVGGGLEISYGRNHNGGL